ncbi:MAG: peptidylprolyl isomerase [Clostridia bacterium]|nr:peptidylprolyl isomerase [Clostridia bacterium]
MNKVFRILALCAALMLALSCCAPSLAEAIDDTAVLVTFDGEGITAAEVKDALANLIANGYVTDETDYATAIDYLLQDRILQGKIAELGLNEFTAEEEEALKADAESQWQQAIDTYVSYFLSEDTEEARAQARQDAEAYYASYGYNQEALFESLKNSAAYDKLEEKILEGKDVKPTEDEIRAVFEEYAAMDQQQYEGNVYMYEMYQAYYGADSWYKPEGYRGIIHILLSVDEELLSAYQEAQAAFEDSVTDETPDGDAALKTARDEAHDAVLASRQTEIDDIYARLAEGEDFAALVAEYGEDPGMTDAAQLAAGYEVHQDSVIWDPVFTAGAFSEKMQQPGDTSDPVVGSYGIHILHYLRDIPGGIVELTDEISAEIEQYLENQSMNSIYAEALEGWKSEHEIVYDNDAIALLTAQAASEEEAEQTEQAE